MARKPNYRFDRLERERQKAAKKADRLSAKQAKAAEKNSPNQISPIRIHQRNKQVTRIRQHCVPTN